MLDGITTEIVAKQFVNYCLLCSAKIFTLYDLCSSAVLCSMRLLSRSIIAECYVRHFATALSRSLTATEK